MKSFICKLSLLFLLSFYVPHWVVAQPVVEIPFRYDICASANFEEHARCRLEIYMNNYPQSQLRDVYKFCFQDFFGIEHLLSDSMAAVRYVDYELNNSDTNDWNSPLFYYRSLLGNYVRVDIGYVRKGIIPMGTLVSAMLKSSEAIDYDADVWRKRWHQILDILQQIEPKPLNYDGDYRLIEETIDKGQYAVHHSRLFNTTYHEHYRIVRFDIFIEKLLPLIEAAKNNQEIE